MRRLRNEEILRQAERARIARMVRATDQGWLFYPPGGAPVMVGADDAARIEALLVRRVERLIADMRRMQSRIILVAMIAAGWLMLVTAFAPQLSGLALTVLTPALFAYTVWEGLLDLRFRIARRRWCRAEAARLDSRRPVDEVVAMRNRRTNLFQLASHAAIVAGVARMLWLAFARDDPVAAVDVPALALVAAGWLLQWPAWRVDATHRRRRWVD